MACIQVSESRWLASNAHRARHAQHADSARSRLVRCSLIACLAGQERAHWFVVGQGAGAVFTHTGAEEHPRIALQWRQPLIEQQGEGTLTLFIGMSIATVGSVEATMICPRRAMQPCCSSWLSTVWNRAVTPSTPRRCW